MPIYEYECNTCHHKFDLMQKMSDAPARQCPQCLNESVVRLVSAAGFQLKGTGWYATDFKNNGQPPKASAEKSSDAKNKEKSKSTESAVKKKGESD